MEWHLWLVCLSPAASKSSLENVTTEKEREERAAGMSQLLCLYLKCCLLENLLLHAMPVGSLCNLLKKSISVGRVVMTWDWGGGGTFAGLISGAGALGWWEGGRRPPCLYSLPPWAGVQTNHGRRGDFGGVSSSPMPLSLSLKRDNENHVSNRGWDMLGWRHGR